MQSEPYVYNNYLSGTKEIGVQIDNGDDDNDKLIFYLKVFAHF